MDLALDIVINPDLSKWWWKDEEEFADMIELGILSPSQAQALRTEGEKAIQMAVNNQPPFCDGWERWSPPGNWQIPVYSANWERSR